MNTRIIGHDPTDEDLSLLAIQGEVPQPLLTQDFSEMQNDFIPIDGEPSHVPRLPPMECVQLPLSIDGETSNLPPLP